jgi:hypothetical protein
MERVKGNTHRQSNIQQHRIGMQAEHLKPLSELNCKEIKILKKTEYP